MHCAYDVLFYFFLLRYDVYTAENCSIATEYTAYRMEYRMAHKNWVTD